MAGGAGCAGAAAATATGLGGAGDLAAMGGGGGGGDAGWLLRPPLFRTAATATVITRPPPPAATAAPAALALLGVPGADRASPAPACLGDLGVAALPAAALPAVLPPLPPAAGCCWSSRRDASCAILHSSNGVEKSSAPKGKCASTGRDSQGSVGKGQHGKCPGGDSRPSTRTSATACAPKANPKGWVDSGRNKHGQQQHSEGIPWDNEGNLKANTRDNTPANPPQHLLLCALPLRLQLLPPPLQGRLILQLSPAHTGLPGRVSG